jgi:hypothetical protein
MFWLFVGPNTQTGTGKCSCPYCLYLVIINVVSSVMTKEFLARDGTIVPLAAPVQGPLSLP